MYLKLIYLQEFYLLAPEIHFIMSKLSLFQRFSNLGALKLTQIRPQTPKLMSERSAGPQTWRTAATSKKTIKVKRAYYSDACGEVLLNVELVGLTERL